MQGRLSLGSAALRISLLVVFVAALLGGTAAAVADPSGAGAGEARSAVAQERLDEGRLPGQPDLVRKGGTTYSFDPATDSYVIDPDTGPTAYAHIDYLEDEGAASPGSVYNLPSQEATPFCRSSGNRIIPVFTVRPGDSTATATGLIRSVMRRIEWKLEQAVSQSSGGSKARKLAVDCEAGGVIRVRRLITENASLSTISSAAKQSFGDPTGTNAVKYLAFDLQAPGGASGFGEVFNDATKSTANVNATKTATGVKYGGGISSVYESWESYASLHELLHLMGAVQGNVGNPAPFSSPGRHCLDGIDVMCYDDGSKSGYAETRCPLSQGYNEPAKVPIDCGNDTYFDAVPASGSWLDQNWNVAGSENPFMVDPSASTTTKTTAHVAQTLNGNPGWATIDGNVTATSGAQIDNVSLNVNFKKYVNGNWSLIETKHPVVSNGYYRVDISLGPGDWMVRTAMPSQGIFGSSESAENEAKFTLRDGYQFVNTNSGKCLDIAYESPHNAAQAWQYECHTPATNGQTFILVPVETAQYSDHFQIVARNSNKCVDVRNDNQVAGELLQQWACANPVPSVQVWRRFGGSNGWNFAIQHSGQCMDVFNSGTTSAHPIVQWPCNGTNAQGWQLKSVNAPPVTTKVSLGYSQLLHGEPGLINLAGDLDLSGYPPGGATVNVNLAKKINGTYQFQEDESFQIQTDGSGHFEKNYYGIGVGDWQMRAVFLGNSTLGESASGYTNFTVRRGYHLVNKVSGKCLSINEGKPDNGTKALQWDCSSNPQAGDGQLFTWYPMVSNWPYFQIRFNEPGGNNNGKCLDVPGLSQTDGVQLQLWDCLGESQDNQLWKGQGGGEYLEFLVKHSNKCLDNWFSGANNGNKIDQYGCNGTNAQKWKFVPVG